mmetsp:Transcript_19418/g.41699  ORF Transcript_19418/g.41699 Transcript_19418/m.41699 type:complete len:233 (-) Transcript_19418:877-1575(-)
MFQLLLVFGTFHHQTRLLLGEVRPLLLDDDIQQLILQPNLGDHEVEQGHFHSHLWKVMRISQLRCHEELELSLIFHSRLTELDHDLVTLFEGLAQEHRLNGWIGFLQDVFDQHRVSKLNASFQTLQVIAIGELCYYDVLRLPHLLDPSVRLPLRIDAERPSSCLIHDDAILDAEGVVWQPPDDPISDFDWLAQTLLQRKLLGAWNLLALCQRAPLHHSTLSKVWSEGSEVCD